MVFNKFRLFIIARIILLCLTMIIAGMLFYSSYYFPFILLIAFFVLQIYSLIHYTEISNRDLKRFLDSIRYSDFSQSFMNTNLGPSFSDLRESFSSVITDFQKQRNEKEEHHQYLQTILKHIGVGFISFDQDGKIELINPAAQKLLGSNNLVRIKQLNSLNTEFESVLHSLEPGENHLLRIENHNGNKQLALNATGFLIKGKKYKLVTLQNITGELERERMARELEIARNIQMKLIPQHFPDIPGYDISGICEPAKEVGGDYFDFAIPDKNKLGLIIGDVSGKGVPASIYMTLSKGIFQSYAEGNSSPKKVLSSVNYSMQKLMEKGTFITIFYGILDYDTNEFVFCRAGHNPLIYYDSAVNQIKKLIPSGVAVGFRSTEDFNNYLIEERVKLNPGDYLLFYTDGLTEAKNSSGEFYGEERLNSFLLANLNYETSAFIKKLKEDINSFVKGTEQYDDITVIALRKQIQGSVNAI
jgi:serine phosphatase RsbU (regulator of sigma subunit)